MKRLVFAIALVLTLGATCADAAVAHVKDFGVSHSAVTSWTWTTAYVPGGTGDAVIAVVSCASSTSPTLTLTGTSWTFTQVGSTIGSATAGWLALFKAYAPNTTSIVFASTSSVTCNSFAALLLGEFSGADATNFIDGTPCNGTATSGSATCSYTPVTANDGLIFLGVDTITTISGGYTLGADDAGGDRAEWKILSGGAGVAQTPSWTASGAYTIFGVGIKSAAGGGGSTPNKLSALGVGPR